MKKKKKHLQSIFLLKRFAKGFQRAKNPIQINEDIPCLSWQSALMTQVFQQLIILTYSS